MKKKKILDTIERNDDDIPEEEDIGEFLEKITPLIEKLAPQIVEYERVSAPKIRRGQYINFAIMAIILLSISFLAWEGIIDGSAATGLIGAVIGYVFGGLYQARNK